MNYQLPFIPERPAKPRESGLTMMMDKGLSVQEAANFIESSGQFTDLVKFGFGTGLITEQVGKKVKLFKEAGIRTYFGGTLFEAFVIRGLFDEYRKLIDKYGVDTAEISDGSMVLPHDEKLNYIRMLSDQMTVVSEVGSKVAGVEIPHEKWISMMKSEIAAGSWKVIAEARESGNIGIYNKDGTANTGLIDDIVVHVKVENIIWEAPIKGQQAWFIKLLGPNVNLGNIATQEVVALETLRLGLRGDTFFEFLPEKFQDKRL